MSITFCQKQEALDKSDDFLRYVKSTNDPRFPREFVEEIIKMIRTIAIADDQIALIYYSHQAMCNTNHCEDRIQRCNCNGSYIYMNIIGGTNGHLRKIAVYFISGHKQETCIGYGYPIIMEYGSPVPVYSHFYNYIIRKYCFKDCPVKFTIFNTTDDFIDGVRLLIS